MNVRLWYAALCVASLAAWRGIAEAAYAAASAAAIGAAEALMPLRRLPTMETERYGPVRAVAGGAGRGPGRSDRAALAVRAAILRRFGRDVEVSVKVKRNKAGRLTMRPVYPKGTPARIRRYGERAFRAAMRRARATLTPRATGRAIGRTERAAEDAASRFERACDRLTMAQAAERATIMLEDGTPPAEVWGILEEAERGIDGRLGAGRRDYGPAALDRTILRYLRGLWRARRAGRAGWYRRRDGTEIAINLGAGSPQAGRLIRKVHKARRGRKPLATLRGRGRPVGPQGARRRLAAAGRRALACGAGKTLLRFLAVLTGELPAELADPITLADTLTAKGFDPFSIAADVESLLRAGEGVPGLAARSDGIEVYRPAPALPTSPESRQKALQDVAAERAWKRLQRDSNCRARVINQRKPRDWWRAYDAPEAREAVAFTRARSWQSPVRAESQADADRRIAAEAPQAIEEAIRAGVRETMRVRLAPSFDNLSALRAGRVAWRAGLALSWRQAITLAAWREAQR